MSRPVTRVADTQLRTGQHPGHRVRVVVEPGDWERTDPFLAMMEDWFGAGTFGPHPHRGFETITFILEGQLRHRDNHGGEGVLDAGDAQLMTAGRGVIHEEEPATDVVHTLQLWLNLPAGLKMTEPRYQDLRASAMPVRIEPGAEVRVFSGHSGDAVAPTLNHVPLTMLDIRLDKGARLTLDSSPSETAFIYVVEGTGTFGPGNDRASSSQVIWFEASSDGANPFVEMRAESNMRAICFSATPLREPVVASGPFVMNTAEELKQAYADFRAGGFDPES